MALRNANQTNRKTIGWIIGSLLAAVASSACCILPAIALIAGVSGFASSLSWLEPARPYLAGLAVISLGYAWFNKIRQIKAERQEDCCDNCETARGSVFKSTGFLAGITVFALLMITFPYYSGSLLYGQGSEKAASGTENIEQTRVYGVEGMTCGGCEQHIEQAVGELKGVKAADASYQEGEVAIQCLKKGCSRDQIKEAVEKAGYQVTQLKND